MSEREKQIARMSVELEKHSAFMGDCVKSGVWATRLWEAAHCEPHPSNLTKDDIVELRQVLADALKSVRDHGSSSWDDWLIEKADNALAASSTDISPVAVRAGE